MEANTSHDRYSSTLLKSLNEKLRFMLINARNSQNAFTGYWVSRNNKKTVFEELYDEWLDTPYQLISPVNYDILDNPQKDFLYTVLISTPPTEWGPSNDPTVEKL